MGCLCPGRVVLPGFGLLWSPVSPPPASAGRVLAVRRPWLLPLGSPGYPGRAPATRSRPGPGPVTLRPSAYTRPLWPRPACPCAAGRGRVPPSLYCSAVRRLSDRGPTRAAPPTTRAAARL
ncbi:hypothetical protein GCM10010371_66250 [Streptomyces subrutilus]|uniref:Uncharacterized protein n=1 Tax=Streptomyces subrutilus TaxID=36818 RepID=A0A918REP1_9ACTN|nr:hypothetical protein GCM10010371_66250 [Streptomyces subrutilus]